jgi:hypothetical protein
MSDPAEAWRLFGQVFEMRHILSHELATDLDLNKEETKRLLLMAQDFMQDTAKWIAQNIDPQRNLNREERQRRRHQKLHDVRTESKKLTDQELRDLRRIEGMEGPSKD